MTLNFYKKIIIPKKPGVYFFKKSTKTLYIGKATNLAHRTQSYFQKKLMKTRGPLIVKMIEDATTIKWKETDSVLEALLLESYLIKQKKPEYNTKEKDNKSYNYVVITDEPIPRVFTFRKRSLDILKGKGEQKFLYIFGPFPVRDHLVTALGIIRKIFPFFGKKTNHTNNIEFYKQLGLVPDENREKSEQQYQKNIQYIAMFFQGKKRSLIQSLKKEMMKYSRELKFERAGIIKKQIYSLEHIHDIALLKHDFEISTYTSSFRIEAYDIAHMQGDAMIGVMVVYNGIEIDNSEHRVFDVQSVDCSHDTKALYEVIKRRLSHQEWIYPQLIVVDGSVAQKRVMEKSLREHGLQIPVVAVIKNEKHKAEKLLGQKKIIERYYREIVSLNLESHRFAIKQHTKKRNKNFLNRK